MSCPGERVVDGRPCGCNGTRRSHWPGEVRDIGRVSAEDPDIVLWPAHRSVPGVRDLVHVDCYDGGATARVIRVWSDAEGTWVRFLGDMFGLECWNCSADDFGWIARDETGRRQLYECGMCEAQVFIPDDQPSVPAARWSRRTPLGKLAHPVWPE